MKTTILGIIPSLNFNRNNPVNRAGSPWCSSRLVLAIVCFALLSTARAVVPAPDACYPNYTTAEGCNALKSLTTGAGNTGLGWYSLFSNSTGGFNTGVGAGTLALNDGSSNTAVGAGALFLNTSGVSNTATGAFALFSNTGGTSNSSSPDGIVPGSFNTANGDRALYSNTSGGENTAVGANALEQNQTGSDNTAIGTGALSGNTSGSANTANGTFALLNNTEGGNNTAVGFVALAFNTTTNNNTAIGAAALMGTAGGFGGNTAVGCATLSDNSIGSNNTAVGFNALAGNTEGDANVASGGGALFSNDTGGFNTAVGFQALLNNTTGGGNIAVGANAGGNLTTGNNNIDIGNLGVAGEANTIRIGTHNPPFQTRTFIAAIRGVTTGVNDAINVVIDSNGQLGTMSSSRRFKHEIKAIDKASEAIHALKPVTFHYKNDETNRPEFGLIAEDVANVNPDLVVRDENGEIYTVRYDAVNAMLLNEFLKEHKAFIEEQHKVEKLENAVAGLMATVKEQAAQIQKVSAQLEVTRPAVHVVIK